MWFRSENKRLNTRIYLHIIIVFIRSPCPFWACVRLYSPYRVYYILYIPIYIYFQSLSVIVNLWLRLLEHVFLILLLLCVYRGFGCKFFCFSTRMKKKIKRNRKPVVSAEKKIYKSFFDNSTRLIFDLQYFYFIFLVAIIILLCFRHRVRTYIIGIYLFHEYNINMYLYCFMSFTSALYI